MTTLLYRPLALSGFILLVLPACASTSTVFPAANASPLRASGRWASGLALATAAGILSLGELSEFLYWQFQ